MAEAVGLSGRSKVDLISLIRFKIVITIESLWLATRWSEALFSALRMQDPPAYSVTSCILVSTAIGLRKYRIPSDLRSQAEYRLVSTKVGDHLGILGVVVFAFWCG